MAEGGQQADIEEVLKTYIERTATDGMLKLTPTMKCFETAGLKDYKSVLESQVWTKHQKDKKCTVKLVSTTVLDDTAAFYVMRKKSLKEKPAMTDAEVQKHLKKIKDGIAGLKGAKRASGPKVDAATARLTDTSKYTGSHKERFDADGKGKGASGRTDAANDTGYVGNYKGEGTYEKK